MEKPQKKPQHSRIRDHLPAWEQVVMLVVLFSVWWLTNRLFPKRNLGKLIGILASIAALALIIWASVLKKQIARRKMKNRFQRRIDALKEDGIPITHQNIYNSSIRPDVPVDDP